MTPHQLLHDAICPCNVYETKHPSRQNLKRADVSATALQQILHRAVLQKRSEHVPLWCATFFPQYTLQKAHVFVQKTQGFFLIVRVSANGVGVTFEISILEPRVRFPVGASSHLYLVSVVVITSPLHGEGRRFEPCTGYFFWFSRGSEVENGWGAMHIAHGANK